LRKFLNRILRKSGYQIVRISKFLELLESRFKRGEDFSFVQIGANDGVEFDDLYEFVIQRSSRGLVVEPLPDFYERLRFNYKQFPEIKPVRIAVHSTFDTCIIYRVDPERAHELKGWAAGIASLDKNHHKKLHIPSTYIVEETVPAKPLMGLLDDNGIEKIDLLQIDTEGFDAQVVSMIDFSRIVPTIIKFEHRHLSKRDRSLTEAILSRQGYQIFHEKNNTVGFIDLADGIRFGSSQFSDHASPEIDALRNPHQRRSWFDNN
jgi:FkbM family methyltransferase